MIKVFGTPEKPEFLKASFIDFSQANANYTALVATNLHDRPITSLMVFRRQKEVITHLFLKNNGGRSGWGKILGRGGRMRKWKTKASLKRGNLSRGSIEPVD